MAFTRLLLVSAALAGSALWAPSAQALTSFQTSSSSAFSLTGNSSSTATLSFSRFTPSKLSNEKANVVLLGYDYVLTNVKASGAIGFFNNTGNTINGPFNSQVVLSFDRIDTAGTVAVAPLAATAVGSIPPNASVLPLTGSAASLVAPDPFLTLTSPANYTAPPATPLPSLTGYSASWTYISPPVPFTSFNDAVASGRVAVRWHYSYDYMPVPAPLPFVGAGIGFAWSRSLRRRIRRLA
jgi:hypothetical protein